MRTAALLLALLALAAPTASAAEDVRTWTLKLGKQATPETVSAALDAASEVEGGALALAKALGAARGPAALRGLRELLRHTDREVRTEVLRSASKIGLRSERLAASIYRSLRNAPRGPAERRAAVVALGVVGDGADMEMLLHLAASTEKDTNVRDHAFRAMAVLTGKKLRFVHSRWAYWWHKQETRTFKELQAAFAAAEAASQTTSLAPYETVIQQHGWIDANVTAAKLRAWLRGSRADLCITACRAAAALRLADLAEDIERLNGGHGRRAVRDAARAALVSLGALSD